MGFVLSSRSVRLRLSKPIYEAIPSLRSLKFKVGALCDLGPSHAELVSVSQEEEEPVSSLKFKVSGSKFKVGVRTFQPLCQAEALEAYL